MLAAAVAAGCTRAPGPIVHGPPVFHNVSATVIDSLPLLATDNGRLVCLAEGTSPCPHLPARATWLRDGRFATWNRREAVEVWTPGQVDPMRLGDLGTADGQYRQPVSVGMAGGGYVVLDQEERAVLFYTEHGRFQSSTVAPANTFVRAFGYAGPVAFVQLLRSVAPDSSATLEVRAVDSPGDTVGHAILTVPLPWMHVVNGRPAGAMPVFAELPVFAIAPDSDIIWSDGARLTVTRQGPDGSVRWRLNSDATGVPLSPAIVSTIRHAMGADTNATARASLDSSIAHSPATLPAISSLLLAPDGEVLVVGFAAPNALDRPAYLLDATGLPIGRVAIPGAWTVLLHGGDSILVQLAGANADLELRWLTLKKP